MPASVDGPYLAPVPLCGLWVNLILLDPVAHLQQEWIEPVVS